MIMTNRFILKLRNVMTQKPNKIIVNWIITYINIKYNTELR